MNDLEHVLSFVDPFVHRPAKSVGWSQTTCPACGGAGCTIDRYGEREVESRCPRCLGRCVVDVEVFR